MVSLQAIPPQYMVHPVQFVQCVKFSYFPNDDGLDLGEMENDTNSYIWSCCFPL